MDENDHDDEGDQQDAKEGASERAKLGLNEDELKLSLSLSLCPFRQNNTSILQSILCIP